MKKKIFKPLLIVSVSAVLALGYWSYVQACADIDAEDWYSSMFAPEITIEKGKEPFYRSMLMFYGNSMVYDNVNLFDDENIREWSQFFQKQVKDEDISYLLYNASVGEIDTAIFHLKNSKYPLTARLKHNSLFGYSKITDAKDFLFYVGYARRCEPYVTYNPNGWSSEEEAWRTDYGAMSDLVNGGKKMIGIVKNEFILERYFFQVERLLFMQNENEACVEYYEANKGLIKSNNTIQYRAMGYQAGAYRRMGDVAKANYLYSLVYDGCDPLRLSAYMSFRPNEESDWEQTLSMARTNDEKCTLWQMMGVQSDPLRAMKEIYAIDPASEKLDLLLVRMVNIAEEQFLADIGNYYYYGEDNKSGDYALQSNKVDDELYKFVLNVVKKNNTANKALWKLSAGYLTLVKGKTTEGMRYLSQAASDPAATPLVKQQARLLTMVGEIDQCKLPDDAFENRMVVELKWLNGMTDESKLRKTYAFRWCMNRMAQKYVALGNPEKAHVLNRETDYKYYNEAANCDKMIAFMDRQNKSAFDQFILSVYPYSKKDIVEFQAVRLFYNNKLTEALSKLDEVPGAGSLQLLGDPFVIHINDCHDCDHLASKPVTYTQRSFIERMVELESLIKQQPDKAAEYSFQLANGFYNATYFGNARLFYQTPLVDWGYTWASDFSQMDKIILDCDVALSFYDKAMQLSKNNEFKAKCCFMAAKCEQNKNYYNHLLNEGEDFRSGEYFDQLKGNYSKTKYYKQVISECTYFNKFANR